MQFARRRAEGVRAMVAGLRQGRPRVGDLAGESRIAEVDRQARQPCPGARGGKARRPQVPEALERLLERLAGEQRRRARPQALQLVARTVDQGPGLRQQAGSVHRRAHCSAASSRGRTAEGETRARGSPSSGSRAPPRAVCPPPARGGPPPVGPPPPPPPPPPPAAAS